MFCTRVNQKSAIFILAMMVALGSTPSFGQDADSLTHTYFVGVKAHTGFIIPHSTEIINVAGSRPVGFQLDVSRINRTMRAWNKCNCYSQVGLSLAYFNFQNPDILGSAYNLIAYMEPLLSYNRRLNFRFRSGAGLSYLTDIYDAGSNPTNLFFGSSISGFLMVGFSAHYSFMKYWNANLGVHYNHISNGGLQQPNKGMNFPTINMGVEYNVNPVEIRPQTHKAPVDRSIHPYLGAFGNMRTVKSTDTEPAVNKWQFGVHGGIMKRFTTTNAWIAGGEFSHDASLPEQGSRDGENVSPWLFSLLVGHQFCFGRFGFSQQMGHYTYRDYEFSTDFFQRYAITYLIAMKVSIGISLKAHAQEAEQMDVRMGYLF